MEESYPEAIRTVAGGRRYVTPAVADLLAQEIGRHNYELPHQALSDREHQIFLLIASGKTVSQIADELSLSVKTVSTYRSRILEKMHMKNNAELTHYAAKNSLID